MCIANFIHQGCFLPAAVNKSAWCVFRLIAVLFIASGLVATSPCGQQAWAASQDLNLTEGNVICVGENEVGEKCYVYAEPSPNEVIVQKAKILCGRWPHPSAHILVVAESEPTVSLQEWAEKSRWRRQILDKLASCKPGGESIKILNGSDALLLQCKLRSGGWPYRALLARIDENVYLAYGIPAVLGVLERAIGVISGRLPPGDDVCMGAPTKLILEAMLCDQPYGAEDLMKYYRLMTLGQYYNGVKDFAAAEHRYREALTFHEKMLGEGNPESMDPLMHVALELSNQGRFEEAEILFNQVGAQVEQAPDQADHARYLSYKALHIANRRHFHKALELARKATQLRRKEIAQSAPFDRDSILEPSPYGPAGMDVDILAAAQPPNVADVVQSLYIEAAMLQRLKDAEEAEQVYREAQSTLRAADQAPPLWTPQLKALGARIAGSRQAKDEEEDRLKKAINLWLERAPGERPGALDYLGLGRAYQETGHFEEALVALQTGVTLVKDQRGSLRFGQLLPFFKTALELSRLHPARREELNKQMFEASQLVRGGRTRQDITRATVRLAATPKVSQLIRNLQEAEDERFFHHRILAFESVWQEGEVNRKRIEELLAQDREINQRIKMLNEQVQAALPRYNQLIDAVVEADDVIGSLHAGEALVQILLGDTESLVFLVRKENTWVQLLPVPKWKVNENVDRLRNSLKTGSEDFDIATAHQLYRQLLSPIADHLENVDHLVTVVSGKLLSLPLGLLVTEVPPILRQDDTGGFNSEGAIDYVQVQWLAKGTAVSLVPSVRSFIDLRSVGSSRASRPFAGFGNPEPFSKPLLSKVKPNISEECLKDRNRVQSHFSNLLKLELLPGTKRELKNVSQSVVKIFPDRPADIFLESDFNERAVTEHPLKDYRILYFATHAVLPGELKCQPEPSLVASLSDPPGKGEDGLIDAGEILKLKLDADLVVLSACNTGGPGAEKEIRGENLSGLARAFFFAGSRAILASHWSIPDKETADFMSQTFARLYDEQEPASLAGALNLAQRTFMNDSSRSHPYFWAGFSLIGDGARVVSKPGL